MKIWEVHAINSGGRIRTTHDGHADVAGLIFSEKAYLLVVRDIRPHDLIKLVETHGPNEAARILVAHYDTEESLNASAGRALVADPAHTVEPLILRNDEASVAALPVGRL